MMFCERCHVDVGDCKCPDIDERLSRLAGHPNIEIEFCAICGKHHARCRCGVEAFDAQFLRECKVKGGAK